MQIDDITVSMDQTLLECNWTRYIVLHREYAKGNELQRLDVLEGRIWLAKLRITEYAAEKRKIVHNITERRRTAEAREKLKS